MKQGHKIIYSLGENESHRLTLYKSGNHADSWTGKIYDQNGALVWHSARTGDFDSIQGQAQRAALRKGISPFLSNQESVTPEEEWKALNAPQQPAVTPSSTEPETPMDAMSYIKPSATHTPEPWFLDRMKDNSAIMPNYHHISAGENFFNERSGSGFALCGWMSEADARLIKNGPALLAALENAVKHFDFIVSSLAHGHKVSRSSVQNCAAQARAAIAEATGGATP